MIRRAMDVMAVLVLASIVSVEAQEQVGLVQNDDGSFKGYTLFAPIGSTTTYLIDNDGRVVNTWKSKYRPGQSAYLLENGHLLRAASVGPEGNDTFHGGGTGGRVQEFTWDGTLVWDFEYSSDRYLLHHDIERLPNGNVLMIAWERKSADQATAAGRDPTVQSQGDLWADHIIEVEPTGKTTGAIVWEWHVWDHLVQDIDPSKTNYGSVADHPELVNINPIDWMVRLSEKERKRLQTLGYLGRSRRPNRRYVNPDWNHTNSIAYNAQLDQIALSVLGFNEIWIIDHSTTSREAAGHTGGKSGRGGDLLYRWGNPLAYRAGSPADQQMFAQHDVRWIPPGIKGAGHLLVFNNGRGRIDGDYSSVDEIVPPVDEHGRYFREPGVAFGPIEPVWSYVAPEEHDFYSGHISGAQRLPNGNTLVCSGENGTIFEVTPTKDVVWKYVNPVMAHGPPMSGQGRPGPGINEQLPRGRPTRGPGMRPPETGGFRVRGSGARLPIRDMDGRRVRGPAIGPLGTDGLRNQVFRAYRYGPDFPGLAGKDLTPGKPIEATLERSTGRK